MAQPIKDPDLEQYKGDPGLVQRWLKEIELVEESTEQQNFEKHGDRIIKKFKNASEVANYSPGEMPRTMFNVLWSNIQVLEPALYSRMPKVVGERVFKDHDPIGRFAAEIAERATHFNLISRQDKFNYNVSACVQDRLLVGRGQGWLVYRCEWTEAKDENGDPLVDEVTGQVIRTPKPNTECVEFVHLNYKDYLESKARTQYEVRWRSRTMYFTRAEAVKEFGEDVGSSLQFDTNPLAKKKRGEEEEDFLQQAKVYQIYDDPSKEVLFISKGFETGPCKKGENPLGLKDFWCCPIPLLATTTTDSTYPTADYIIYEGLAEELDYLAKRLSAMVECVRLVGLVASAHNKEIKKMLLLKDGELTPMANWQSFADKGGLKGVVDWLPFDMCVAAIPVLEQRFISLKGQVDEITSMPDIVRGSSDPNDPVYTQQQKSHWTVIKLVKKQQDVQRFCREIVSKMAEIIFEPGFFSDETIALMCGVAQMSEEKQAMFPEALALLRNDRLRTFRIDIETDSTIAMDEDQAIERWFKYLEGLNGIFSNVQAITQFKPELLKPMLESAIGAVRVLRTGRAVEGSWEKALEEIEEADKAARENPQPPPPDPALLRAQVEQEKAANQAQKDQAEFALNQQKLFYEQDKCEFDKWLEQQKLMLESQKIEGDHILKDQANQIDAGEQLNRKQIDQLIADMDVFQGNLKAELDAAKLALEKDRLEFDKRVEILKARETVMEEMRLAKDQQLEHLRIISEHVSTAKQIDGEKSEPKETKAQPPINIHLNTDQPITVSKAKKRKHKAKKNPDGSYDIESEDVEEAKE